MSIFQDRIDLPSDAAAAAMIGPGHSLLDRIQSAFGVTIQDQGRALTLFAPSTDNLRSARAAIDHLLTRLNGGHPISAATVDDYLRLRPQEGAPADPHDERPLTIMGRTVASRSKPQARMIRSIVSQGRRLIFALGDAGTGKTFMAVAIGLSLLKNNRIDRMVISRPAVAADEEIGFLPGDMDEKLSPYVQPVYDAIDKLVGRAAREKLTAIGDIDVIPTGFLRGRTFERTFVIADESQNLTFSQMKMVLTRIGEGAIMVITGDPYQNDIDLPPDRTALMRYAGAFERLNTAGNEKEIDIIRFGRGDVLRDRLVRVVLDVTDTIETDDDNDPYRPRRS